MSHYHVNRTQTTEPPQARHNGIKESTRVGFLLAPGGADVVELPGLGPSSKEKLIKLKDSTVESPSCLAHLLGWALLQYPSVKEQLNQNSEEKLNIRQLYYDKLMGWLKELKTHPPHRKMVVLALLDKLSLVLPELTDLDSPATELLSEKRQIPMKPSKDFVVGTHEQQQLFSKGEKRPMVKEEKGVVKQEAKSTEGSLSTHKVGVAKRPATDTREDEDVKQMPAEYKGQIDLWLAQAKNAQSTSVTKPHRHRARRLGLKE